MEIKRILGPCCSYRAIVPQPWGNGSELSFCWDIFQTWVPPHNTGFLFKYRKYLCLNKSVAVTCAHRWSSAFLTRLEFVFCRSLSKDDTVHATWEEGSSSFHHLPLHLDGFSSLWNGLRETAWKQTACLKSSLYFLNHRRKHMQNILGFIIWKTHSREFYLCRLGRVK